MTSRTEESKDRSDRAVAVRRAMKLAVTSGSVHGLPAHVSPQAPRKTKHAA
jgi:hypothetical protein